MARRRTEVEAGSGNVFADLGYADARERSLKVELAMEVSRILGERGLSQERAAKRLGIRQPHVSDLVRYRLNRFSVEGFMDFLTRLGRDVEIRIAPRPSGRRRSAVQVSCEAETRFYARAVRGAGKARRGLRLLAKARGEGRPRRSR